MAAHTVMTSHDRRDRRSGHGHEVVRGHPTSVAVVSDATGVAEAVRCAFGDRGHFGVPEVHTLGDRAVPAPGADGRALLWGLNRVHEAALKQLDALRSGERCVRHGGGQLPP